jgi:hypothetical protein
MPDYNPDRNLASPAEWKAFSAEELQKMESLRSPHASLDVHHPIQHDGHLLLRRGPSSPRRASDLR